MKNQSILKEIIATLGKRFSIRLEYEIRKDGLVFDFSNGLQNDYEFKVWVNPEVTQSTIGARLKMNNQEDLYFWYIINDLYFRVLL